jgi:uncharacterized protein YggU (UPF0235/DUF167 family)
VNPRPWKAVAGGLLLAVRTTPKAGRDAIGGVERLADGSVALKARVRAAPHGGQANAALVRMIARAAGVPPSAVALARGAAGRLKTLHLTGDPVRLEAALEAAVQEGMR